MLLKSRIIFCLVIFAFVLILHSGKKCRAALIREVRLEKQETGPLSRVFRDVTNLHINDKGTVFVSFPGQGLVRRPRAPKRKKSRPPPKRIKPTPSSTIQIGNMSNSTINGGINISIVSNSYFGEEITRKVQRSAPKCLESCEKPSTTINTHINQSHSFHLPIATEDTRIKAENADDRITETVHKLHNATQTGSTSKPINVTAEPPTERSLTATSSTESTIQLSTTTMKQQNADNRITETVHNTTQTSSTAKPTSVTSEDQKDWKENILLTVLERVYGLNRTESNLNESKTASG